MRLDPRQLDGGCWRRVKAESIASGTHSLATDYGSGSVIVTSLR